MKKDCENCEYGMIYEWRPTRHGFITNAVKCDLCKGTGEIEEDWDGDDPYRPTMGGMPSEYNLDQARRMK